MLNKTILILIFIFIMPVFVIKSQIIAPQADYTFSLTYNSDTSKKDSVYVFHSPDKNGVKYGKKENKPVPGGLTATRTDTVTFVWKIFNPATLTFNILKTDSNQTYTSIGQFMIMVVTG